MRLGLDFKTRFAGKVQKISKDGGIEDVIGMTDSKPV
jgi:hypothetical protein